MTQMSIPFDGAGAAGVNGKLVIASVSGGKDSGAMALLLKEREIPHERIFMDTGWEHPSHYEYLRGPLTAALGPITELRGELDFVQLAEKKGLFPSRLKRFCTTELKVLPALRYIRARQDEVGDVVNAVGIRRAESQARSKMLEWEWNDDFDCWVWRPLVTWSHEDVLAIHKRHGLPLNPIYAMGAGRVGCWPCIHAGKRELAVVARTDPDRIYQIRKMEEDLTRRGHERDLEKGRAPVPRTMFWYHQGTKHIPIPIDDAVAWANSKRGEWRPATAGDGCARLGMCAVDDDDDAPTTTTTTPGDPDATDR